MTAIQRRVMTLERKREAQALADWWEGCRQLWEPFMERLTDDELREVAAAPDGNMPAWYTERFNAFIAADPDRNRQAGKVDALEQWLLSRGYELTTDESGAIVFPGMARP